MCLTCSCGEPRNRHGDLRNITADDLEAATETEAAGGISMDQAVVNFADTVAKDRTLRPETYRKRHQVTKPRR